MAELSGARDGLRVMGTLGDVSWRMRSMSASTWRRRSRVLTTTHSITSRRTCSRCSAPSGRPTRQRLALASGGGSSQEERDTRGPRQEGFPTRRRLGADHRAPQLHVAQQGFERVRRYLVNDDCRLFSRYASNPRSPWKFQFTPTAIRAIAADEGLEGQTYIALICGDSGVYLLDTSELWELLSSIPEDDEPQSVAVISPPRKQFEVRAGAISLGTKVPRTRFPREVLEH